MPVDRKHWPNVRRKCYQGVRDVIMADGRDRAQRAYELQCHIMEAIIEAEEAHAADDPKQVERHIHLLRLCVDSLTYVSLHPHTIRQLGKNVGGQPRLSGQRDACQEALVVAKEYADIGVVALVSDLSNLLRISDVVVCDDLETPTLIECKAQIRNPEAMKVDRPGRQLSRALGALNYIRKGAGMVIGEKVPRLSVDSGTVRTKSQEAIERVIAEAREKGTAYELVSPSDLIICIQPTPGATGVEMEPFMHLFSGFRQVLVGSYACALWNPSLRIPPAIIWDLDFESAAALMEEELLLIHVIDLMRFCDLGNDEFRVTGIITDDRDKKGPRIETMSARGAGTANISFVYETLFWYFTIESSFEAIEELHQLYIKAIDAREYERAEGIEIDKISIVPTKVGAEKVLNIVEPGSYRMRARSGDEFIADNSDVGDSAS